MERLTTDKLQSLKQAYIETLLNVANVLRTEANEDNRYALEVRRGELLGLLRSVEAALAGQAPNP